MNWMHMLQQAGRHTSNFNNNFIIRSLSLFFWKIQSRSIILINALRSSDIDFGYGYGRMSRSRQTASTDVRITSEKSSQIMHRLCRSLCLLVSLSSLPSYTRAMSTTADLYAKATTQLREISTLGSISGILGWDEMVLLPEAASLRGKQKAVLSGIIYDKSTNQELGDFLKKLSEPSAQAELDDVQKAVIRDSMREYIRSTALPKDLVTRQSELESEAYAAWVKARQESDYSTFAPFLEEWITLSKKKANYIDSSKKPYNVLVDTFEKGMTSERLDDIFTEVREGLVPLITNIKNEGTPPDNSLLKGKSFDVKKQAELCHSIALDMGFDIKKGRLDTSVHPFTGGSDPTDVRMTTRFKELDITEGLTGAIHETGHALYEQGRNLSPEWEGLCVSEALSMGVHEVNIYMYIYIYI